MEPRDIEPYERLECTTEAKPRKREFFIEFNQNAEEFLYLFSGERSEAQQKPFEERRLKEINR